MPKDRVKRCTICHSEKYHDEPGSYCVDCTAVCVAISEKSLARMMKRLDPEREARVLAHMERVAREEPEHHRLKTERMQEAQRESA